MKWIIIAFFALYLVGYTLIHNTPLGLVLLFILLLAVGGLVLYYKYRLKDRFRVGGTVEEELKKADSLDGHAFEYYVARLLPAMGFTHITVTQGSGDYGVDVIAYDGAVKIAIQCKLYGSPVGVKAVQEVYAGKAHYHADLAAVITNNYFTEAARTLAEETGVELWDRDTLAGLILEAIRKQEAETVNSTQTK